MQDGRAGLGLGLDRGHAVHIAHRQDDLLAGLGIGRPARHHDLVALDLQLDAGVIQAQRAQFAAQHLFVGRRVRDWTQKEAALGGKTPQAAASAPCVNWSRASRA
ncbi:hypothetical protein [Phaeovulum vinaykumarii]|uniref:hypothetical protein n=1 Tax=Phaeovulum vinaykumarii TaxID=407234 RepID=UPI0009706295|nr:hypothetical protein [Phaeovulum vinaykumarii]